MANKFSDDRQVTLSDIYMQLGKFHGGFDGINQRLDSIEKNCVMHVAHSHEIGSKLAIVDNAVGRHERKISDLYKRIECTENTGMTYITETKATRSAMKTIWQITIGLIAASASIFAIVQTIKALSTK